MIFVSYSRRDRSLVQPLVRFLRASGQQVFVDQENLDYGSNWREQVRDAIAGSTRFLLFWSKGASRSNFVEEEWRTALENRSGVSIVPVMLDRTPLPDELSDFHGTDELQDLAGKMTRLSRWTRALTIIVPIVLVVLLAVPVYQGFLDEAKPAADPDDQIVLRGGGEKTPADLDTPASREAMYTFLIAAAILVILLPVASYSSMTIYRRRLSRLCLH